MSQEQFTNSFQDFQESASLITTEAQNRFNNYLPPISLPFNLDTSSYDSLIDYKIKVRGGMISKSVTANPNNDHSSFDQISFNTLNGSEKIKTGGWVMNGDKKTTNNPERLIVSINAGHADKIHNLKTLKELLDNNNCPNNQREKLQKKLSRLENDLITLNTQLINFVKSSNNACIQDISPYMFTTKIENLYDIDACMSEFASNFSAYNTIYQPLLRSNKDSTWVETGSLTFTTNNISERELIFAPSQMSIDASGLHTLRKEGKTFHCLNGTMYSTSRRGQYNYAIGNMYGPSFATPESRFEDAKNSLAILNQLNEKHRVFQIGDGNNYGVKINTENGHDKMIADLLMSLAPLQKLRARDEIKKIAEYFKLEEDLPNDFRVTVPNKGTFRKEGGKGLKPFIFQRLADILDLPLDYVISSYPRIVKTSTEVWMSDHKGLVVIDKHPNFFMRGLDSLLDQLPDGFGR